ncbi:MAG: hypothetical protein AMJ79_12870 [Phycisphaerae bacterium SM23_30]|nr:MAG: hypothetical protein AMJ79_12870 [Phycisphaerae bacterium SM23_30]
MLKKIFLWTFIAGLAIGIPVKGLLAGPTYALVVGGIFSLVFGLILWSMQKILPPQHRPKLKNTGIIVAPILFILLSWFSFFPPAKWLFKTHVISPIPDSVTNIKSHMKHYGPDITCALKFNVDEKDFEKIIKSNSFAAVEHFALDKDTISWDSKEGVIILSLPVHVPWFRVSDIVKPALYVKSKERIEVGVYFPCIIYDESNNEAFYLYETY